MKTHLETSFETPLPKGYHLAENCMAHGRAEDLIPRLPDNAINLLFTSPPYAMQRRQSYGGVSEEDYPRFIGGLAQKLLPKLKADGNLVINLKAHVRNGEVSDYVLRSILAIKGVGYRWIDELIWLKPDQSPLGRTVDRPRRTWEHLLWFSPGNRPFIDVRACSTGTANWSPGRTRRKSSLVHGKQQFRFVGDKKKPRITDVITVPIGGIERNVPHPAMFPEALPRYVIRTFSRPGDLVADIFLGSGQTALAAESLGRRWWGCDQSSEYVKLARARMAKRTASQRQAG